MAMYSNAKPQLLLHQPNIVHQLYPTQYKKKKKSSCQNQYDGL